MTLRRHDMKRPCTHCPFRTDDTAIRFATRERAQEIEASAYLFGFPCHTTADYREANNRDRGNDGFVFAEGSQHCVGYLIMQLKVADGRPWPGIGDDVRLMEHIASLVDFDAPVFEGPEDFFRANE